MQSYCLIRNFTSSFDEPTILNVKKNKNRDILEIA